MTSEPYEPVAPGNGESGPPLRDDVTLRDEIREIDSLLRTTRDADDRASLLRKRAEVERTLADRREQRRKS